MKQFEKKCIGLSRDIRTNVWKFTCSCGKIFKPETTIIRYQNVKCPKCGYEEIIDYNAD